MKKLMILGNRGDQMSINYRSLKLVSDKLSTDPFLMDQLRLTAWLCKTYAFEAEIKLEFGDVPLIRRANVLKRFFRSHHIMMQKDFDHLPAEKVTPLTLAFLAHHESDVIKMRVASHLYTPAETRVMLAEYSNSDVREAALRGIRIMLAQDYSDLKYPAIGTPEQKSIAKEALISNLRR